jgi:hypothetical protein
VFLGVFLSISSIFFYTLQVLCLDVLKIDLVLHMLRWLYMHVSSAYFMRFICFKRMLQVFHLDASKVDLGEAHVAAVANVTL